MIHRRGVLLLVVAVGSSCTAGHDVKDVKDAVPNEQRPLLKRLACFDVAPVSVPAHCGRTSDCTIVQRPVDCCGTSAAMGIHASGADLARPVEQACSRIAVCECLAEPAYTEDGLRASWDNVGVRCEAGQCRTYSRERVSLAPWKPPDTR